MWWWQLGSLIFNRHTDVLGTCMPACRQIWFSPISWHSKMLKNRYPPACRQIWLSPMSWHSKMLQNRYLALPCEMISTFFFICLFSRVYKLIKATFGHKTTQHNKWSFPKRGDDLPKKKLLKLFTLTSIMSSRLPGHGWETRAARFL